MWKLTAGPPNTPNTPEDMTIFFEGLPVKLEQGKDGKEQVTDSMELLTANTIARRHGIGGVDVVENHIIGIKIQGVLQGFRLLRDQLIKTPHFSEAQLAWS